MSQKVAKQPKDEAKQQHPRKTYRFRIYPTRRQTRVLEEWLGLCCEVYNAALDERRSAYRVAGVSLSYAHQCAELPACKEVRPELREVPAQVLQDAVKRVDRAYDAFFRRVDSGEEPGYPRFKSRSRYDSLTFKQHGNSFQVLDPNKKKRGALVLAKLGQVGLDVGLKTFAYLSTGEAIPNPRFFRAEEVALVRAQRKLSKACHAASREREKKRKVVARVHERIGNRRKNFIEQQVGKLIKRFGLLAVEALVVRNMVKNPKVAKSIADASWSTFIAHLLCKAEEAGREVVRVDPAYTSQTCSACGHRQSMPLSVRVYECPRCGLVLDRDYNGSKNILEEALKAVGRHSRVIPEAPGAGAVGSRHACDICTNEPSCGAGAGSGPCVELVIEVTRRVSSGDHANAKTGESG